MHKEMDDNININNIISTCRPFKVFLSPCITLTLQGNRKGIDGPIAQVRKLRLKWLSQGYNRSPAYPMARKDFISQRE